MNFRPALLLLAAAGLSAGCGGAGDEAVSAPNMAESARLARGELLSYACQACHSLAAGADHQIGPNLHGIFGRAAATAEGFTYSDALRGSSIVWTPEVLDRWMADPAGFLPGTTMAFTGYASAEDRQALIDYLVTATGDSAVAE